MLGMIFRKTWKGVRLLAVYYVMSYAVISKEILFEDKKGEYTYPFISAVQIASWFIFGLLFPFIFLGRIKISQYFCGTETIFIKPKL